MDLKTDTIQIFEKVGYLAIYLFLELSWICFYFVAYHAKKKKLKYICPILMELSKANKIETITIQEIFKL